MIDKAKKCLLFFAIPFTWIAGDAQINRLWTGKNLLMHQADSVSKILFVLITTIKCELVAFPPMEDYCSKSETSYHSDLLHTGKVNFSAIIFGPFCKAMLSTKQQSWDQCTLLTSSLCNGERQACVRWKTWRHLSETTAFWCLTQWAIGTKQAAVHFQGLSITNYAPKWLFLSLFVSHQMQSQHLTFCQHHFYLFV